jgi:hypothetical protein
MKEKKNIDKNTSGKINKILFSVFENAQECNFEQCL